MNQINRNKKMQYLEQNIVRTRSKSRNRALERNFHSRSSKKDSGIRRRRKSTQNINNNYRELYRNMKVSKDLIPPKKILNLQPTPTMKYNALNMYKTSKKLSLHQGSRIKKNNFFSRNFSSKFDSSYKARRGDIGRSMMMRNASTHIRVSKIDPKKMNFNETSNSSHFFKRMRMGARRNQETRKKHRKFVIHTSSTDNLFGMRGKGKNKGRLRKPEATALLSQRSTAGGRGGGSSQNPKHYLNKSFGRDHLLADMPAAVSSVEKNRHQKSWILDESSGSQQNSSKLKEISAKSWVPEIEKKFFIFSKQFSKIFFFSKKFSDFLNFLKKNFLIFCKIVYDMRKKEVIGSRNPLMKRQIGSLNKMVTFMTALDLIEEMGLNTSKIYVKVSREAAKTPGSSAGLEEGDILTMYDLFFGKPKTTKIVAMMLPNGNDAAICLTQTLGFMDENSLFIQEAYSVEKPLSAVYTRYWQHFVSKMNKKKTRLGLSNSTNFVNPHGLPSLNSCSTVKDLLKICLSFMNNKFARKVSATR